MCVHGLRMLFKMDDGNKKLVSGATNMDMAMYTNWLWLWVSELNIEGCNGNINLSLNSLPNEFSQFRAVSEQINYKHKILSLLGEHVWMH